MNHKAKDLEKVSFGIAVMFGLYWTYSCFIKRYLPLSDSLKTTVGLGVLYVIGLGFFLCITHKIPACKYDKKKVPVKTVFLCFLLQFTSILVFTMLVNVSAALGLGSIPADSSALSGYMLFLLLLFNPVVEELVFRKLFARKLLKYGERFYILASSFCFAVVHGVSLGIPQIVYTFILGMIWSYLTVKTGDIKLAIFMHGLSNLFGSIITQTLLAISLAAAGIYSMMLFLLGITGFVLFLVNRKKIVLDGSTGLVKKAVIKDILTNKGILFFAGLTGIVMLLK